MKKYQIGILILFILFLTLIPSVPASAEDMMDNLLPQEEKKEQEGKVKLEYNKYPLSRYGMDTQLENDELSDLMPWGWDDGVGKQMNQGLSMMNSTLWGFNKIVAATVGTLVTEAYELNIVSKFSDDIASVIKSISGFGPGGFASNGLWPYLATSILCIAGIWAAYTGIIKRSSNAAMSGIISTIIIMAVGLGFFTNAEKILSGINDGVTEVQNDVLSFSLTTTSPGKYEESEGMASMRNQIFNLMIKNPYLLLNFGTSDQEKVENKWDKKGSRVDTILKTKLYSKARKDAIDYEIKELKNDNMKPESLTDRFIILIFALIANCILGTILLLLSCSMIFYQVLVLIFAVFSPVAFLMGLIPAFSKTATNLIMKLLHAFYMKIALALLMTIYFSISSMVYNSMDPKEGYILLFVIQIICAVTVWVKRHEILNVVTTPFRNANVNNNAGQSISDFKKSYFKTKKHINKFTKPFTQKHTQTLAERTGYNKLKAKPGVGMVDVMRHPMYTTKERNTAKTAPSNAPIKRENNQDAPAAASHAVRKQENVSQPQENAQPIMNKDLKTNKQPEQSLNDRRNLESLEKTLEKGGHAHNAKERIQLKERPVLKDRLAERAVSTHNEKYQPVLRNRPTTTNKYRNQE